MSSSTIHGEVTGTIPPAESRSVTIVIPCLNEEGNLDPLFHLIKQAFDQLGFTLPVLLIDDGSTDSTPQVLEKLSQSYSFLQVIRHPHRCGVTSVWITALQHVETDWIFWGQADLESNPEIDVPMLLKACGSGVDAIAGWRQGRGDGKVFASTFANSACRFAFGLKIHDMNWIKLVRRDLLLEIPIEKVTHRYLLAILAAKGYTVKEVRTPWFSRYTGTSKFGKRRLVTSMIDFVNAYRWFFVQRRIHRLQQYVYAMAKAGKVGLREG